MAIQSSEFGYPVGNHAGAVLSDNMIYAVTFQKRHAIKTALIHSFWTCVKFIIIESNVADALFLRYAICYSDKLDIISEFRVQTLREGTQSDWNHSLQCNPVTVRTLSARDIRI